MRKVDRLSVDTLRRCTVLTSLHLLHSASNSGTSLISHFSDRHKTYDVKRKNTYSLFRLLDVCSTDHRALLRPLAVKLKKQDMQMTPLPACTFK